MHKFIWKMINLFCNIHLDAHFPRHKYPDDKARHINQLAHELQHTGQSNRRFSSRRGTQNTE